MELDSDDPSHKNEYSPVRISFTIYVCDFQSEVKAYATQYTPDSRGATVATGGGFADLSGYNNHGELVNGVSYNSDNCRSLVFDGIDDGSKHWFICFQL